MARRFDKVMLVADGLLRSSSALLRLARGCSRWASVQVSIPLGARGQEAKALLDELESAGIESAFGSPRGTGESSGQRRLTVASRPETLAALREARGPGDLVVALAAEDHDLAALDRAGAEMICRDPWSVVALLTTPSLNGSLSLVLLAYNEAEAIDAAVAEARRFGELFASGYEVVVVDDGSHDDTGRRLEELAASDLRVVTHEHNQGMGASLRDGFTAARGAYVAPLPADRQVRPTALLPLLPLVGPEAAAVGYYEAPHEGGLRALLSAGFRFNLEWIAGLSVPFDGTYCVPRRALQDVDEARTRSSSFVYSYELLEQLRRRGITVAHRPVRPFRRQSGGSKVANPRRVARVLRELVQSRLRGVRAGVRQVTLGHGELPHA